MMGLTRRLPVRLCMRSVLLLIWVALRQNTPADGIDDAPTMIDMYRTISGTCLGVVAQNESSNCPKAAPNGLARVATAVALMRP